MVHPLKFSSLSVKGFRGFRDLEIERLGAVNLIVGTNGVGKTALIEAIRVNAFGGSPWILRQLLLERDEVIRSQVDSNALDDADSITRLSDAVSSLFYGRKNVWIVNALVEELMIQIGSRNKPSETVEIEPVYLEEETAEDRARRYRRARLSQPGKTAVPSDRTIIIPETVLGLAVRNRDENELLYALYRMFDRRYVAVPSPINFPMMFVPARGIGMDEVRSLWAKTTLTTLEEYIKKALNAVSPANIEAINVVGDREFGNGQRIIAKAGGFDSPVPLRSLGEGATRAFGLSLAMVNARDGVLAVDEIDSGLHYSVQYELWKLILTIAKQLRIQVFATTHSWDCVAAFQEAAGEDSEVEGLLIRLERKGGDIAPTLFGERELSIATREQIEVR